MDALNTWKGNNILNVLGFLFKRIVHPENKCHLLTLMSFQTWNWICETQKKVIVIYFSRLFFLATVESKQCYFIIFYYYYIYFFLVSNQWVVHKSYYKPGSQKKKKIKIITTKIKVDVAKMYKRIRKCMQNAFYFLLAIFFFYIYYNIYVLN